MHEEMEKMKKQLEEAEKDKKKLTEQCNDKPIRPGGKYSVRVKRFFSICLFILSVFFRFVIVWPIVYDH